MTDQLQRRRIGTTDMEASVLSLGSWHTYDRMDFADAVAMIRYALDRGVNLFDIGVYAAPGHPPVSPPQAGGAPTDVLFGAIIRAVGARRDDYLVSSKLWLEGFGDEGFRPQLENALMRAGLEHTDLVVLGDVRRDDIDLEAVVVDLGRQIDAGLIRAWGVNNWSATNIATVQRLATEHGIDGPQLAQLKYSLARRSIPDGEPFAKLFSGGLSMEASDVLEGGILAGRTEPTRQIGRDPGDIRERIKQIVPDVLELARTLDTTAVQLAIAFTLAHPATTSTLFGASSLDQVKQNLEAPALLERIGADELRAAVEPFWVDKGIVDPEGP